MNKRFWGLIICLFLWIGVNASSVRILEQIDDTVACNRWVEEQLARMTLKQKVGQLFIHTVAPVTLQKNKNSIEDAVKEYGIGGLLFSKGELNKQVQLTNLAQQWADIPLLITFDGEWGLGMRLEGMPEFPRNRVLGCIQNDTLIYQYGREVARQLREIGVHVNFAPVADVDNNPSNPVINVRSFGSDPKQVARKVIAYSRGLEDGGVMAVCKHFPGHGDTDTDSHYVLPVLNFNRDRLDSVELYPFREAIKAGIGGMMIGHLHVAELDNRPASISSEVITSVLCKELGFSGLVFTDALEMKGISDNADNPCAQALMAGNDLLLVPRNLKKSLESVMRAIKAGKLSEKVITEKCRKVLMYKYALGLSHKQHIELDGIKQRIHTAGTDSLLAAMEKAAVTVLKDSADVLPLDLSLSGNVLLSLSSSLSDDYPFYKELKKTVSLAWLHGNADSLNRIQERVTPAQQVIVAVHPNTNFQPFLPLLEKLAVDKPVVIVCFASQDILQEMPSVLRNVSAVILAHTDKIYIQQYVADVMTGQDIVNGRLSVDMAGLWKSGTGITLDPDYPRSYTPEELGMNSKILAAIDTIAEEGIREKAYPGCHVLITKDGYPVYNKCFGSLTYEGKEKVREHTIYDLASLSKAAGTLLAVMKLYDEGKFGLTDKVSLYLPALRKTNKQNITIQDLLFHESGLPSYLPFYEDAIDMKTCKGGFSRKKPDAEHRLQIAPNVYVCTNFSFKKEWVSAVPSDVYSLPLSDSLFLNKDFKQVVMREIINAPLKGHSYRYSCLNFMLLKEVVESITKVPMDVYLDSVFFKPMGLMYTAYNPLKHFSKEQIAPTAEKDFLRGGPLQGYVHDEAAAFMGGVSGNAGLFSTAHDVSVLFQMLLDRGICGDRRYLSRATCDLFMSMKSKNSRRGLGFDKPDMEKHDESPCTPEAPASVFGHTGFTGTCVWADPDNDLVFVFLSNRTYPTSYGQNNLVKLGIRSRIQQAMYQSLMH